MKEEYQDRIENYLLNRMSDKDRLAFEQDLEKDAELREQYEFISMVKTALMLENIGKDVTNWNNAYKEREEQSIAAASFRPTGTDCYCPAPPMRKKYAKSHSSGRKILYWISGLAAVFIVGIFIFHHLPSPSPEIANESTPLPNYSSPTKEGNISFKGRGQMDIESQLAMGDYSKALAQIEKDEAYIRMELIRLEPNENTRGVGTGEEQDSLENKLSQLLYWKANALIGLNRKDEAIILLDEIRHSESKYKEQADSLYIVLQERR